MDKEEAARQMQRDEIYKFLGTLSPPMIYLWREISKFHKVVAESLGLDPHNSNVRAGYLILTESGNFAVNDTSMDFPLALPSDNQLQRMISGDINFI